MYRPARFRPILASVIALLLISLAGCVGGQTSERRDATDAVLFGPASMRLHPIFTAIKDWTGDNKPDGIEALVELQDQFGDPTKASGKVIFHLYEFRKFDPERRGLLLAEWIGDLSTLQAQRDRWNRTSRTYSFQLAYGELKLEQNYLLAAEFQLDSGTRLFNNLVIQQQITPSKYPVPDFGLPPGPLQPGSTQPGPMQPGSNPTGSAQPVSTANPTTMPLAPTEPGIRMPAP